MENILNKLKPIERLYLISKEKEELYIKKNKVFCILYSLISHKNLFINKSKGLKVNYNAKNYPTEYEMTILNLIGQKEYLELNSFIDKELIFNKTLIDLGILKEEVKVKKRIFFKTASTELIKTTKYHMLQGYFSEQFETKSNVLKIVCDNEEYLFRTAKAYSILKSYVQKAVDDEMKAKEEEKKKK